MGAVPESDLPPIPFCNLGNLVAENDSELRSRYVSNPHYEAARDFDLHKLYFIGRKGMGKSALLQMIRLTEPSDHIIDLGTHDIGLDLLVADAATKALSVDAQGLVFRSLWRAALLVKIHESLGVQWRRFSRTRPQAALDAVKSALDPSHGRISLPAVLRSLLQRLRGDFEACGLRVSLDVDASKPDFTDRLAKTEFMHNVHLASENLPDLIGRDKAFVLIDDLDQNWRNEPLQNRYISALFNTIERLARIQTLKFVVALRLDIFRALDLDNKDKLVQHIQRISWSPKMLRQIVMHRLKEALSEPEPRILRRFELKAKGDPIDAILKHCLQHPRDAIWTFQSICDLAAEQGRGLIDQGLVDTAMQSASTGRVEWICSEWRGVYPWLPQALKAFAGGVHVNSVDRLKSQLSATTTGAGFDHVVYALLETGALGMKRGASGEPTFFPTGDPPLGPYSASQVFELHPALRKALQSGRWSAPG